MSSFVVQIKLEGAQADFANAALDEFGDSNVGFARAAFLEKCAAVLGKAAPSAVVKERGAKKGSKIEMAAKLGLTTKEFRRRVKVLTEAGIDVTEAAVAKVPAKVKAAK